MLVVRLLVAAAGVAVAAEALSSAVRTVVLPRAVPSRTARLAFLTTQLPLRALARRAGRKGDATRRDTFLALQGPVGIFAQIAAWTVLVAVGFTAILWSADRLPGTWTGLRDAARESGSSLSTLGIDHPVHAGVDFLAYTESGIGLVLLALAVTYLPTLYAAFSRRETLVAKLSARAGSPPDPVELLARAHRLGELEELGARLWEPWEEWLLDVGETHTSFPQLMFFRSPRANASWLTAAITVMDAAALAQHALEVPIDPHGALVVDAGSDTLELVAGYLGVRHGHRDVRLPRAVFDDALERLAAEGVPVVRHRDAAWDGFAGERRRYEALALTLAAVADAIPTTWLPEDAFTRHRPPIFGRTHSHGSFGD